MYFIQFFLLSIFLFLQIPNIIYIYFPLFQIFLLFNSGNYFPKMMKGKKKIKRKEKGEQRLLTCKTNRLCAYLFLSAWLISRREFNGNARNVNVCPPSLIIIPSFAYIFPFKFQSSTSTRSIFPSFFFFFFLFLRTELLFPLQNLIIIHLIHLTSSNSKVLSFETIV